MPSENVDVLIIAALKEEFDALIEITDGEEAWNQASDNKNFTKYYYRNFESTQGFSFCVAAMWANKMAATSAAVLATQLTEQLNPRCIAMCGICAGKPKDIFLGDVLVADKLFRYDEGKRKVQGENEVFQQEITTYNLKPKWKTAIEEIKKKWQPSFINERSLSVDYQSNWLLRVLAAYEQDRTLRPHDHPDINNRCPNRQAAIKRLRQKEWIESDSFQLTSKGKQKLEEDQFLFPDSPKADPQFSIHLGPIGTGTAVIQDSSIWNKIADYQRKIIGLEMEGEAIGIVSEIQEIEYMIFVKGVCDYADEFKDDSFHHFAAKASAAFLIDFLKGNLPKKSIPPDFVESDKEKLFRKSREVMEQVLNKIGGQVHLERKTQLEELEKACAENCVTVLVGISGVGKSSLARDYAEKLILEDKPVLWFEARSFEKIDFASFETDLQLTHSLETVIQSLSNQPATLILDGLDRLYTPESFQLLSTFLRLFKLQEEQTPWRLLVTCQTQELSRLSEHLIRIGIPKNHLVHFSCNLLSVDELEPIWQKFPSASRLKYQTHLKEILGNLKILDLVTIKLSMGEDIQVTQWVDESSVATWFWESYIKGSDRGIAKAKLVKQLAESQAETLKQSVSLDQFDFEQSQLIESLIKARICSQTPNDSIIFQHDLYGDWFRFRLLISHSNNLVNYLRESLTSPMWHRAVRLYGLYLLEHLKDINQWSETLQAFADDNNLLAQDLLLEAPVFAANPLPLLKLIHSNLIDNEGQLLKRLLTRFLNSATFPDPFFLEIARSKGYDETEFAATFRYPYWPFWLPVLRFLYDYREQFIQIAPVEICQIMKLWLDHTSQGTILRLEVAEIGLMLGEYALLPKENYRFSIYDHRKDFYRTALIGARELPEKVSDFALRGSERIARSNTVEEDEELNNNILSQIISLHPQFDPNEPLPEPWPDGPKRTVDDDFRNVVLEAQTLLPLIQANPSVAREVVLAVLISARRNKEWDKHWTITEQLDMEKILGWSTPLYTLGPFLTFLKTNFSEGLEVIARLVDFATERWQYRTEARANEHKYEKRNIRTFTYDKWKQNQNETNKFLKNLVEEHSRFPKPLIISIDNFEHEFIGDSRVYGWSSALGYAPPDAVIIALMALEQYFYLKIKEEEEIDEKIKTALIRVKSVAFLNVLCNIGKRRPILFETSLKPLLSVPEIYDWDISVNLHGRSHLMIGASWEGELFFKLAKEFNQLEHRKKDLRRLACELFLTSPIIRTFFEDIRQRWELRLSENTDDELYDFIQQLIVTFDIQNYELQQHSEYGQVIVNVEQQKLQEKRAEERHNLEINMLIISFPLLCRKRLDENSPLNADELEAFWQQIQQISSIGDENHSVKYENDQNSRFTPTNIASCISGGIAVLIHFHHSWLSENPEREQWCLEYLRNIVLNPPQPEQFDTPEKPGNVDWDCFVAEALPLIWGKDKDNQDIRFLMARMVCARHYNAVNILFSRCSELRSIFLDDFTRLRGLLFEWAFVRNRINYVHSWQNNIDPQLIQQFFDNVNKWGETSLKAFIEGNMPSTIESWKSMDKPKFFCGIDKALPSWRRLYYLDFQLIQAGHTWLPTLDKATNAQERYDIISFWREALAYVTQRVSVPRQENQWQDHNYYPRDNEQRILKKIAMTIQYMQPDENPERLWQAIIDLPKDAHHWSEIFLREFHQYGLQQNTVLPAYISITRDIVNYVLPLEADTYKWSYHEEVWDTLLGLDQLDYWDKRHRVLVKEIIDLIENWIHQIPIYHRRIARLARWLQKPATKPIRLQGLIWIKEMVEKEKNHILRETSVTDAIASLLDFVWYRNQNQLRQDTSSFETFKYLLHLLTERQNKIALELIGRIGS